MILEEDSITHPDIILKYDENTRLLSMLKNDEGLSRGPYYNSYHQIDMYTEAMYWKIDDPLIELSTLKGSTQHYAAFESLDYYKELRYMALLGRADVHPLVLIKEFVDDWGSEEFPAYDLAKYMRRGEEQLEPMLIDLTSAADKKLHMVHRRLCFPAKASMTVPPVLGI